MKEKRLDTKFRRRMRRRLYYGDMADLSRPSLPLTELAVNYFHDSATEKLGHVDLESASRMIRSNKVSPCSVVMSMLYAKRLRQRSKAYLQTMSSSDVFFISMMMASKYLYDEGVDEEVFNDEWADSVDQDVDEVNTMEIDFLNALDWRLFVRPEEFEDTLLGIERRLALGEGLRRGWFTYTEMDLLLNTDLMSNLWHQVGAECSKMVTAFSALYLTGVLSMVGSTVLACQLSGPLSSATVALLTLHSPNVMSSIKASGPSLLAPLEKADLSGTEVWKQANATDDPDVSEETGGNDVVKQIIFELPAEYGVYPDNRVKKREKRLHFALVGRELSAGGEGMLSDNGPRNSYQGIAGSGNVDLDDFFESTTDPEGASKDDAAEVEDFFDDQNHDGKEGEGQERTKMTSGPSSFLSFWFFDSLLTQLWTVSGLKSRPVKGRAKQRCCCQPSCDTNIDLNSQENLDLEHLGDLDENQRPSGSEARSCQGWNPSSCGYHKTPRRRLCRFCRKHHTGSSQSSSNLVTSQRQNLLQSGQYPTPSSNVEHRLKHGQRQDFPKTYRSDTGSCWGWCSEPQGLYVLSPLSDGLDCNTSTWFVPPSPSIVSNVWTCLKSLKNFLLSSNDPQSLTESLTSPEPSSLQYPCHHKCPHPAKTQQTSPNLPTATHPRSSLELSEEHLIKHHQNTQQPSLQHDVGTSPANRKKISDKANSQHSFCRSNKPHRSSNSEGCQSFATKELPPPLVQTSLLGILPSSSQLPADLLVPVSASFLGLPYRLLTQVARTFALAA